MKYKLAVRYSGDSGYAGEIEAESYTREIKLELLSKATRMMNLPGFGWQIVDENNNIMDSYNCGE